MNNICNVCSKNWIEGDFKACSSCRKINSTLTKNKYAYNKENGFCVKGCGNRAVSGETLCTDCKQKKSKRRNKKYLERKENGQCVHCGNPSLDGVFCEKHVLISREIATNVQIKRNKDGVCRGCVKPLSQDEKIWCQKCRNQNNKYALERIRNNVANGICKVSGCGLPLLEGKKVCKSCWAKQVLSTSIFMAKKYGYAPIKANYLDLIRWFDQKDHKKCEWCNTYFTSNKQFIVDHNHITGELRALVCMRCNFLEGLGLDRLKNIIEAIDVRKFSPVKSKLIVFSSKFLRNSGYFQRKIRSINNSARKSGYAGITVPVESLEKWYGERILNCEDRCEWCFTPFGLREPCIDHDHVTGEVRALVCRKCNTAEGHGIDRIRKVIAAIEKWNARQPLLNKEAA